MTNAGAQRRAARAVWERPEPIPRPNPPPICRDAITRAAIVLADREGLNAVSLRKVAASLDTGAMRLYSYIATKAELLETMVDAVYGEMDTAVLGPGWRAGLAGSAHRLRQAVLAHPWLVSLLGARPNLGPHALAQTEAVFATLGPIPIETAMDAVRTVQAYVIGALRTEVSERRAEAESGLDTAAWQAMAAPYIQRMIATGQYPNIARIVAGASLPGMAEIFERGLDCVLDGIGQRLALP
ncbi:TetR/AcrR family transcriptional regulator [Tanticharoenia sakaeratensis]|uniref:TetR family transcriptional regulator n=1 Tax=Tanticharoenia sakaeratensis NBRC 103193 TaxID=1231623 RepID=A0A0D6MPY1_9PROT|nr:TetR/AcrR family transcriptional regulator C-terminal domain-containing protein [Tanticharoenia sakaeratensis]GAN55506.1 TetR family transcriptional regulator [Tanticharoenia sakaeratensis NBRC 103193]GBQ21887.1 TetR family transcriptional regulator [Tanticharoenia sakaeratensis NBRC 103193]